VSTVVATFAPEAHAHPSTEALSAYVVAELRRLFADGASVLLAIHQWGVDEGARILALEYLARGEDDAGERLYPLEHQWRLRLREGAVPPPLDPQGRRLPPELAGKVLRAKVGLLGAQRARDAASPAARQWEGHNRAAKAVNEQPLHKVQDVTAKPAAYSLTDACLILSRWGVGCTGKRWKRPDGWRPGEHSAEKGQDCWLVEEVPASRPAKGGGA
jgi:hypothetical protein